MKKITKVVWGIVLVAVGALFALNALNITNVNVFFDGWWTLFIIVPCVVGVFTESDKTGNIIGIAIGICLLLWCQDVIDFSILWKLIIPACIVIVGIKMVISGLLGNKANDIMVNVKKNGGTPKVERATFSGCDLNYNGEIFEGAELTAVFGGIKCDLRGAVINEDCAIHVCATFGGIDILVPSNVNVKCDVTGIFGGVSNKNAHTAETPTIYINGSCVFGGVEVK